MPSLVPAGPAHSTWALMPWRCSDSKKRKAVSAWAPATRIVNRNRCFLRFPTPGGILRPVFFFKRGASRSMYTKHIVITLYARCLRLQLPVYCSGNTHPRTRFLILRVFCDSEAGFSEPKSQGAQASAEKHCALSPALDLGSRIRG